MHSLFEGLNDVDRATGLRAFQEVCVEPGDVLFAEGTLPPGLLVILEGQATISTRGITVGKAAYGDLLGEMALFTAASSTASAVADTALKALFLTKDAYDGLRDVLHPLATSIEKTALNLQSSRLRAVGDRISQLSHGSHFQRQPPTDRFFAAVASLLGRGGKLRPGTVEVSPSLRRSALFAGAPEEVLLQIAGGFQTEAFAPGAFICTQGEKGHHMYLLDEGEVDVLLALDDVRVEPLATLRPGAMFGAVALVEDRPRMCSCVARTRVLAHSLNRQKYQELVDHPWYTGSLFRRAMIRMFAGQLAEANEQLADLENQALADQTLAHLRKAAVGMTRAVERVH